MSEVNVTWHDRNVSRAEREQLNGHQGGVVWFTGLSGCGKSTIGNLVDRKLYKLGVRSCLLDGDNIRHGLTAPPEMLQARHGPEFAERFGLGFKPIDREENIRRIGAVAQLFCEVGLLTLTAFVSPFRRDRDAVREMVESQGCPGDFVEVFVDTPLEVCESRDPKKLYAKARAGIIPQFTGISDPYENPEDADVVVDTIDLSPEESAQKIILHLEREGYIGGEGTSS